jgi:hypothetical protein
MPKQAMFEVGKLVLATDEDWAAVAPGGAKPAREPRAAPSGDQQVG